jgi:hypothetical protein
MKSPFRERLPGGWPEDAPPRSILYSRTPYGCCGEDRESLGSYTVRLSNAYGMTRWTLTNKVIGPAAQALFDVNSERMARDIGRAAFSGHISSLSEQAYQWAHTLNHLTHRTNLQLCTLLPLRHLVPSFRLLSKERRFCPDCYTDDVRKGRERYDRLLWNIDQVKACPLHGLKLVELPKSRRESEPRVELNLSAVESEIEPRDTGVRQQAPAYEVDCARLTAELLDDAVVFPDAVYSPLAQSAFVKHAIDTLFDGKSAHFAAHVRVCKSLMHGWANGQTRMSLPRLALIAHCCSCAIADILMGNKARLMLRPPPVGHTPRLIDRGAMGAIRPKEILRAELDYLAREGRVTNLSEAADAIGVSRKFLLKNFPKEHAFWVENGRQAVKQRRSETREFHEQLYFKEHNAIVETGAYPSRRRVLKRMNSKIGSWGRHGDVQKAHRKAFALSGLELSRAGGGRKSRAGR